MLAILGLLDILKYLQSEKQTTSHVGLCGSDPTAADSCLELDRVKFDAPTQIRTLLDNNHQTTLSECRADESLYPPLLQQS